MYEKDKINSLLNELSAQPPITEENARKLEEKFRLEFNFNSNHIEGNTLTYGETKLLLIFDKTDGQHEMRDFEEMKAHDVAYRWIKELAEDKSYRLIERDIKQLNEIILVRPFWKDASTVDGQSTRRQIQVGEYKLHPNSVQLQNGELFHYASPMDTPMAMHDLMVWFHAETEKQELSPVELAAIFHYKFVLIHPFDDGNGRISRLLMNYVLLKNNLPPIIIKSGDKKNYLNALNKADTGNLPAFVEYISQQLIWSLQIKLKATKGESIEEENDIDKQVELFKREQLNIYSKKPTRSQDLVENVYQNVIKQILFKINKKIEEFDGLFEHTGSYYIVFFGNTLTFANQQRFENLNEADAFINTGVILQSISWTKELSNSISEKISPINLELTIGLNKRSYEIELSWTGVKLEFTYAQRFTEAEIKEVVNKLYKGIFKIIQSNTKK